MKQKTIHAIVKYFYPVAAGIETNMLETYSVLVSKGWNVTVHTTQDTLTERLVLPVEEKVRGITVNRYAWNILGFFPKISWEITTVIALHNFNITPHIPLLLYILLRKCLKQKVPFIYLTPHGGFTPDWEIFSLPIKIIKYVLHRTFGAYLINRCVDRVRAVSEWEAEELRNYGINNRRIVVIPNGLENEAYKNVDRLVSKAVKEKISEFRSYLLQIGRIYSIKNYETTIRALSLLPKKIHFVIAGPIGSNKYFDYLKTLTKDLGLESRVHFVGVIRGIDKYYLIRKSLCMVHMARWESFCNVVHEGMSQGKLCIVADNTALRLLVKEGKNGFRISTKDEKSLAKRILWVINKANQKAILRIQQHNIRDVSENTWKKTAEKIALSLPSI